MVLFGTGGNDKGGGIYVISLIDLYKKKISKVRMGERGRRVKSEVCPDLIL